MHYEGVLLWSHARGTVRTAATVVACRQGLDPTRVGEAARMLWLDHYQDPKLTGALAADYVFETMGPLLRRRFSH